MCKQEHTLTIRCLGNDCDRDLFLTTPRNHVVLFTDEFHGLGEMVREIMKNIYDHANGKGVVTLSKKSGIVFFHIHDDNTETYSIKECTEGPSRLHGNGINFGAGLSMIQNYSIGFKISLEIDTSNGFSYKGVHTIGNGVPLSLEMREKISTDIKENGPWEIKYT